MEHPELTYFNNNGVRFGEAYYPAGNQKERCLHCGEVFDSEDIYKDYCPDCAEDAFSVENGLVFIEKSELEEKFFFEIAYTIKGIPAYSPLKRDMLRLLKDSYKRSCEDEIYFFREDKRKDLNELKSFCLADPYEWVDFISEYLS